MSLLHLMNLRKFIFEFIRKLISDINLFYFGILFAEKSHIVGKCMCLIPLYETRQPFHNKIFHTNFCFSVVTQRYEVNLMDEHVLRGNTAIIKCHIPSFVADYVYVSSWLQDEQNEIFPNNNDFGTHYWSSFVKHVFII